MQRECELHTIALAAAIERQRPIARMKANRQFHGFNV
jgi:hypothetical protein